MVKGNKRLQYILIEIKKTLKKQNPKKTNFRNKFAAHLNYHESRNIGRWSVRQNAVTGSSKL
jgi:hypothetical protein